MNGLPPICTLVGLTVFTFLAGCASQEKIAARQVRLGEIYSQGTWITEKNDETAAGWFCKAALQGDAEGEYRLGLCYAQGLGVPKNECLASEWFAKAAHQGNAESQFALGSCYQLAQGVKLDLTKAYLWFNLAAASGKKEARESRDAIAPRLTEGEIRQAQSMSEKFWASRRE